VQVKHGTPFKEGETLPAEYKDLFPRHEDSDGSMIGMERNKTKRTAWLSSESSEASPAVPCRNKASFGTEGTERGDDSGSSASESAEGDRGSASGGSNNNESQSIGSKDSDESESSTESVPQGFSNHASEDETDSLHVYDDNYKGDDDNWELYPEEPDSDVDAD